VDSGSVASSPPSGDAPADMHEDAYGGVRTSKTEVLDFIDTQSVAKFATQTRSASRIFLLFSLSNFICCRRKFHFK
jgi:hypothetical protein